MSLNTAHTEDLKLLIHSGEQIFLYGINVSLEFNGKAGPEFKGTKTGKISLTSHRFIFNNDKNDPLKSFSFPFVALSDIGLEQPTFGANYIKGTVTAQENGNFTGQLKFKLTFKSGGAIEFGQAVLHVISLTKKFQPSGPPPPYIAPTGPYHPAPPPAYSPDPSGYYGWLPPTHVFPSAPTAADVYMVNTPPPYTGIFGPQGNPYAGASCPPQPQDAKAAEAAQSAYYDPNRPQFAYVPPPAYYDTPPSYEEAVGKKTQ